MPEFSRLPFMPGRPRALRPPPPKPHHPMHASARSPEQVANETSFESPSLTRVRCAEGPLQQGTSAKFAAPPTAGFIEGHMLCTWASFLSITGMDTYTDACMHRRKERPSQEAVAACRRAVCRRRSTHAAQKQRRPSQRSPFFTAFRHLACCGVLWCVLTSPLVLSQQQLILCHLPPQQ